ncbi:MAG: hypothetical protein FK730_07290 [Asgard group archaeon]|nr:hypothetical protein [Asgard group archaeon]
MKIKKTQLILILTTFSLILLITIFSNAYSLSENQMKNYSPNLGENWTFMLYLCADTMDDYVTSTIDNSGNWLHNAMNGTLEFLKNSDLMPGSESDLNIIALIDNPYTSVYNYGKAELLKIEAGNVIELDNLGSTNMGLHTTLENFIDYCKLNYPANNYALTLSDHGGGYAGYCYDFHGIHPSFEYSYGDCLTVEEIGDAIGDAGGVDVLFFDTCLGASFEMMWQLKDCAHYVVAGETIQNEIAIWHPRDVLHELSIDTSMTPLELATTGFDAAVNPIRCPSFPYISTYQWPSVAIFDLTKFDYTPPTGGVSFVTAFSDFAEDLYDELLYNITRGRILFNETRNEITYHVKQFTSNSMMLDLTHFVEEILSNTSRFHYQSQIETSGNQLLAKLAVGTGNLIVDEAHIISSVNQNMNGFSICFPNRRDYYQGYLYPNFYEYMDISVDTLWDDFIFTTYPEQLDYYIGPIPEFFELNLGPIDPCINLHVYLFNEDLIQEPAHVGYTNVKIPGSYMGLELGIEGAGYIDDMLYGTSTIILPMSSIQALSKNGFTPYFSVVVNASASPSATKPVNLTIRHVKNGELLWEDTKIQDIKIGQALVTEVQLDDSWTDFETIDYTEKTGLFGNEKPITHIYIITTFTVLVIIIIRKRKKKN